MSRRDLPDPFKRRKGHLLKVDLLRSIHRCSRLPQQWIPDITYLQRQSAIFADMIRLFGFGQ